MGKTGTAVCATTILAATIKFNAPAVAGAPELEKLRLALKTALLEGAVAHKSLSAGVKIPH